MNYKEKFLKLLGYFTNTNEFRMPKNGKFVSYRSNFQIEEWFKDGVLHREDGPACSIIEKNGNHSEEWWVNGEQLSYQEFQSMTLHSELQQEIINTNTSQPRKLKL